MKIGDKVRLKKGYRSKKLIGTIKLIYRDEFDVEMIEVIDCEEPGHWQADWWEVKPQGKAKLTEM